MWLVSTPMQSVLKVSYTISVHLCWWHKFEQRLCREEEKTVAVSYSQFIDRWSKTEHTVLKKGKKKNEWWRSPKKLGSLKSNQEDMLRRKQLSTTAFHNLNNTWIRKIRIREHVLIKLCKTIVKPVLLYKSQTWGLKSTINIYLTVSTVNNREELFT